MFSFAKKLVDRLDGASSQTDEGVPDSYYKNTTQLNNKGYALRVLNVKPHSTAHHQGLESWFDYIIRVNGHELPMMYPTLSMYSYSINDDGTFNYGGGATQEQVGMVNQELLASEISNSAKRDKRLMIDVWSAKGGVIRQVELPLADPEEGDAAENADEVESIFVNSFKQIGLTLQSQHLSTATYVWRILNTHQGSPAFRSQLIPYSDYIIGIDSAFPENSEGKGLLSSGGEKLLSRTISSYYNYHFSLQGKDSIPIILYVYNHDYDVLRPVTVYLSKSWSIGQNKGILGCDVGYGLLHRIPEVIGKFDSSAIIEDVVFESPATVGYQVSDDVLNSSPSQESQSQSPPPNPAAFVPHAIAPPRSAAKKKKHHKAATGDFSDYMNEELNKSKEMDSHRSRSEESAATVAPPPKAS